MSEKEFENFEGISNEDLMAMSLQILRSPHFKDSKYSNDLLKEIEKRGLSQKEKGE